MLYYYIGPLLMAALLLGGALYYAVRMRVRQAPQRDERAHWRPPGDVLQGVTDVINRITAPAMVDDATLLALIHATGEVDARSDRSLRQYLEEIKQRCVDVRALRFQYERLPAAGPDPGGADRARAGIADLDLQPTRGGGPAGSAIPARQGKPVAAKENADARRHLRPQEHRPGRGRGESRG